MGAARPDSCDFKKLLWICIGTVATLKLANLSRLVLRL